MERRRVFTRTSKFSPYVFNGDSFLCECRVTATACVTHPCASGETLCKMLQLKSQRYFCALLAKARAACRVLAVSSP